MATPHEPPGPPRRTGLTDAQRWTLGGIAALVLLLVVVVAVLAGDDGGGEDDRAAGTTTTTTAAPTTTTEAGSTTTAPGETTTTAPFGPDVDPYEVAFPSPTASRSFEAPAAAARAYATDVLGFTELVLGAPATVDGGTTEVVVQPSEDGPETRILLVQAGEAWYVTGSETDEVAVTQPAPGTSLATPFQTAGEALAFEGAVEVLVFTQDGPVPVGLGSVTGSGSPPAGPFAGDISFAAPPEATPGILVYRISSAEDGRVLQATSLRVRLTNLTA